MAAKKLIEVALPLDAINKASVRESFIYRGNPSALHKWWAQRPLAAARAVLFSQMVDDPSSHPELFETEEAQEEERRRLFGIINELVRWESTTDEEVLQRARDEIFRSWRDTCADNTDHPQADRLFDPKKLPDFHDPFAGGGTLPLEAQRLGLESYASDLNPVSVLINKAMIEFPTRFAGSPPVSLNVGHKKDLVGQEWKGAQGLAEDVRYYGELIRERALERCGHLYPEIEVTTKIVAERPDLRKYEGRRLKAIAWIWSRTVKSPNPAFSTIDVPLAATFMLSTRARKEAYVEPKINATGFHFVVKVGTPADSKATKVGTKLSRGANFKCLLSGAPIAGDYIKAEGQAGRMGTKMMAIVAEGDGERIYLSPTPDNEAASTTAKPDWKPDIAIAGSTQYIGVKPYGMELFSQLYVDRQLVTLSILSDLVQEARETIIRDAIGSALTDDKTPLRDSGCGATAYAEAVMVYLAFSLSKMADYNCALVPWYTKENRPGHLFSRQAIPMVWDFAELNPLGDIGGTFLASNKIVSNALAGLPKKGIEGHVTQKDAVVRHSESMSIISTDPPYYDNVPYADLSDFFYTWLRRSLKPLFPDLFAPLAVPKADELVAFAHRHDDGKVGAESFFLSGMTQAMHRLAEQAHPAFPVTIYYAFKQSERSGDEGITNTGWDTFLAAVIDAGFTITGTWPIRTERESRSRGIGSNALASSVVLVCRPCATHAPTATRRQFVAALKDELPRALAHLQSGNIAPVDLAQAAIGPGMAVFTRFAKVLDAEGELLSVRQALELINQTLDEALAEQEGDFDADSRWALTWFEESGFAEGDYGIAEQLSKSKNTSVGGLVEAGILASKSGKVRLLRPDELPEDWRPATDARLTVWEIVHHLIRALNGYGEGAAAEITAKLGSKAEVARELAYRLYTVCERKKRAKEAMSYNGLVQSWTEILRLAREVGSSAGPKQGELI
jgi:putative DNA methylase